MWILFFSSGTVKNIYNMCLLLGLNSQQSSCSTMRLAKTRVQRKRKRPSQVYIGIDVQSSIAYPEAGSEETKNWDTPLAFHVCLSSPSFHWFPDFSPYSVCWWHFCPLLESTHAQGDQVAFHIGNYIFTLLFVAELAIRWAAQGWAASSSFPRCEMDLVWTSYGLLRPA